MQSKSVIGIRHVPFEDLDSFAPILKAHNYEIAYREVAVDDLSNPDLASADLLVVLGGPIGVYEERRYPFLRDELALIEKRLARGRPTLGICLGAQLMARAMGAKVYPGGFKEIGWARLVLTEEGRHSCLGRLGPQDRVLHWHGDTFDLPEGATRLASTLRTPNQAFAVGSSALGLQFHLEATVRGLERWFVGHAFEISATQRVSVSKLRADTVRFAPMLEPHAQACLNVWLDGLELRQQA